MEWVFRSAVPELLRLRPAPEVEFSQTEFGRLRQLQQTVGSLGAEAFTYSHPTPKGGKYSRARSLTDQLDIP
jgi:hypothetical protein